MSGIATVNTLVRRLCRIAGIAGIFLCGYALVDPSIMAGMDNSGPFAAPAPRWRAAFGLVFSAFVFACGMAPHAHRNRP